MERLHVEAEGETSARPEVVWGLVSDANGYCQWGIWSESAWDPSPGGPPGGPGSVRRLRSGRTRVVEQILEVDDGRRMVYTVLRGLPVRNYRAEVTLTPVGAGTHVRWSAEWDRTPLGRIVRRRLPAVFADVVSRLVAAAEETVRPDG